VGRVWPRHGHCGRPLNSVVSPHVESMNTYYGSLPFTLAIICGVSGCVGVVACDLRERTFLRKTYWKWLALSAAMTVFVLWMYEPEHLPAVLRRVVVAWGLLIGLVVGGVLAALIRAGCAIWSALRERRRAG
jgi:hypothetical protein